MGLPALVRAERLTEKASAVGFDWPETAAVLAKVREELAELTHELETDARERAAAAPTAARREETRARIEAELGDLLFALANLGRFVQVHPEEALRGTLRRFESRFHHVEARLLEQGRSPRESTLAEMDGYWDEAKKLERKSPSDAP